MKANFISYAAVASILLFSPLAMAEGSHCDSLKGHGPHDMSAEQWQQFKDNHAWMFSKDAKDTDKSTSPESAKEHPVKPSHDSMAI